MTYREFYNAVINNNITDEVIAIAKAEIEKLDARNEKRRNTMTKEQKANEEIKGAIVEFIGDKSDVVASDIAKACNLSSTQKASALCQQMVESGVLAVSEVKIKGKGAVKGYRKA